jgi:hypothetical protein
MSLLIAYVALVVVGQAGTIVIGLLIDYYYSPAVSLTVSIALYFFMFWLAWIVAVRVTEPKSSAQPPAVR